MEQLQSDSSHSAVFDRLDNYDWDDDREFQGGLRAILDSASYEQAPRLIVRAKCYYFARKFKTQIDFDGYLNWTQAKAGSLDGQPDESTPTQQDQSDAPSVQEASQSSPGSMGNAPHPASFAEICELIAAGKPIPGIKDIPDTVLEGQATPSQAPRRKKPWEKDAAPAPTPSWARAG